jgi:hypothetical protein
MSGILWLSITIVNSAAPDAIVEATVACSQEDTLVQLVVLMLYYQIMSA